MRGQLRERGRDTWLIRVYLGEVDGKRKELTETFHGSKTEARKRLTALVHDKNRGLLVQPSKQKVREYFREWLANVAARRVQVRTLDTYRQVIERYVIPHLGHVPLAKLTGKHVDDMYAAMLGGNSERTRKGLSPRTIRIVHAVLRLVLAKAVRDGALARNVADYATLPRQDRKEMDCLTQDEAAAFLRAALADEWAAWWTMLLMTGMRPGEASGLLWSDIDGESLTIRRSLTPGYRGTWRLHEAKTARSHRTVVLGKTLRDALAAHRDRQEAENLIARNAYGAGLPEAVKRGGGFVFADGAGQPVHYSSLGKRPFLRVLKAAGLRRIRQYDLRHTSASVALANGENIKVVSERLGHANPTLVLTTYGHVLPGMQEGAAERMEKLLAGYS